MNQITDTEIVLNSIERIYKNVHQTAENVALIHNMEKSIDQKATVIGCALVQQKQLTQNILNQQSDMEKRMEENGLYVQSQRQELRDSIDGVMASVQQLRNLENREDVLLNSVNRLSKNQSAFMKTNQTFAKSAETDLEAIRSTLMEIRQTVLNMDIVDQAAFMDEKASYIQEFILSHVNDRMKIISAMNERIKAVENKISFMQKEMAKQKEAINGITSVSKMCEQKIFEMCEKLDALLAKKEFTPAKENLTLEDMFATANDLMENDDEALGEWMESETKVEKSENEVEVEEISDPAQMKFLVGGTVCEFSKKEKKKNFFKRMFGGNE